MRLSREESRERTRERLIEAAGEIVARDGYDATSISSIAEAAGFTKGAFFSNFESKDALLLELLSRCKAVSIQGMRDILLQTDAQSSPLPALSRYFASLDNARVWYLLDIELQLQASRNPEFAERYNEIQQTARTTLGKLVEELYARAGRALPESSDEYGGLFQAIVNGLALAASANPDRPRFDMQLQLVADALLAAAPIIDPEAAASAPCGVAAPTSSPAESPVRKSAPRQQAR